MRMKAINSSRGAHGHAVGHHNNIINTKYRLTARTFAVLNTTLIYYCVLSIGSAATCKLARVSDN
jgi:hypothetical protein